MKLTGSSFRQVAENHINPYSQGARLNHARFKAIHTWKNKTCQVHPGRLTWNIQITHFERKMIFQTSMIRFHVNLPGCTVDDSEIRDQLAS